AAPQDGVATANQHLLWRHADDRFVGNDEARDRAGEVGAGYLVAAVRSSVANNLQMLGVERTAPRAQPASDAANPSRVWRYHIRDRRRAGINHRLSSIAGRVDDKGVGQVLHGVGRGD